MYKVNVSFIRTWVDSLGRKYARFLISDDRRSELFDILIRTGKDQPELPRELAADQARDQFDEIL